MFRPEADEIVGTIEITPNFEQTSAYIADALIKGRMKKGSLTTPIVSLIEQIRYLTQTDMPAVQRVIDRIQRLNP